MHSLFNLLESSSSFLSIAWLRFFCSTSSPPVSVLPHPPIVGMRSLWTACCQSEVEKGSCTTTLRRGTETATSLRYAKASSEAVTRCDPLATTGNQTEGICSALASSTSTDTHSSSHWRYVFVVGDGRSSPFSADEAVDVVYWECSAMTERRHEARR